MVGQKTSTTLNDDLFLFRPAAAGTVATVANTLNQLTTVNAAPLSYDQASPSGFALEDANGNVTKLERQTNVPATPWQTSQST